MFQPLLDKTKVDFAVVAALPPPVTGNVLYTDHVVKTLQQRQPVALFSLCRPADAQFGRIGRKLMKLWRTLGAGIWLMARINRRKKVLYTAADAGWGQLSNIIVAAVGRFGGYRVIVNHHSFSYIDCYDWRMDVLQRCLGRHGMNVFLCECMQRQFCARYGDRSRAHVLPVYFRALSASPPIETNAASKPLVLGHLSNLCVEKGSDLAIDTFRALIQRGVDARLVLAGPAHDQATVAAIAQAQREFGERFEHRGPVKADAVGAFYREIDVFLFPTRYRPEAQPAVLVEALTAGCPVITYDRGCIRDLVGTGGGIVIERDQDFVDPAVEALRSWSNDPHELARIRATARQRGDEIRAQGSTDLDAFAAAVQILWDNSDNPV